MPLRAAAICGLLAPVTFIAGLLLGDLAQPEAFSPADDNISDVGAQTAGQAWLYNQIAANLNGLLIVAFALGLWSAVGSGWTGRVGVLGLAVLGVTRFLEGFLRLDCRSIDSGCENTSWQSDAHGIESGIASALFFVVPPLLAFAFRRLPQWRNLWLPTLLAVPVVIAASVLLSVIGDGAAVRAASITWFLWLGLVAWRLLRIANDSAISRAGGYRPGIGLGGAAPPRSHRRTESLPQACRSVGVRLLARRSDPLSEREILRASSQERDTST